DGDVAILDLLNTTVAPAIWRQWIAADPAATGELVEIGARVGIAIERFDLDTRPNLRVANRDGHRQRYEQERDELFPHQAAFFSIRPDMYPPTLPCCHVPA